MTPILNNQHSNQKFEEIIAKEKEISNKKPENEQ